MSEHDTSTTESKASTLIDVADYAQHERKRIRELHSRPLTIVRESSHGHRHEVFDGAPCEWSKARGATHTLVTSEPGTRPAILKKTRLIVGIDEGPNETIVWETWNVTPKCRFNEAI